jgi:signal transduction histidine kinase
MTVQLTGPGPTRRALPTPTLAAIGGAIAVVELAALVLSWDRNDWHPIVLLAVLSVATVLGEFRPIEVRGVQTSTTGFVSVLPMVLLGPGPAVFTGLLAVATDSMRRRPSTYDVVANVLTYVALALFGGIVFEALDSAGAIPSPGALALAVFVLGLITDVLCFGLVALSRFLKAAGSMPKVLVGAYGPIAAFHVVISALVGAAAFAYVEIGLGALLALLVVIRVSETLLRAVAAADARASEIQELADERTLFLTQSLVAEEHERDRLASHLHDEALQLLAAASQDLQEALEGSAVGLERGFTNVNAAMAELRRTLTHFHPAAVAAEGLRPAFETLTRQLCRRSEAIVDVPDGLTVADPSLVYTIGRELIANAGKHARANTVRVSIEADGSMLRLIVEDDGQGFDPDAVPAAGHVGLLLTEHRVSAAGGRLSFVSTPGDGTRAEVCLPRASAAGRPTSGSLERPRARR